MTVLFEPSTLPYLSCKHIMERFHPVIVQRAVFKDWHPSSTHLDTVFFEDLERVDFLSTPGNIGDIYSGFLTTLLTDHRTLLLAERTDGNRLWNGAFSQLRCIEKIATNSLSLLIIKNISCFLSEDTPHNRRSWILAKAAEYLNIPVFFFARSPLPWRFWLVRGIEERQPQRQHTHQENIKHEEQAVADFIAINNAQYEKAIPTAERERFHKRHRKMWSWRSELKEICNKKSYFFAMLKKRKLYNDYCKLATPVQSVKPRISVFLHRQPERTSLPEGLFYTQQWLMIRELSLAVSSEWEIVIKEHPSTFLKDDFNPRYRDTNFYVDLAELKNVRLASLDDDPFSLIEASQIVATLTGKVGVQALSRGKPVLAFGCPNYRGAFGVFQVSGVQAIRKALVEAKTLCRFTIQQRLSDFLLSVNKLSMSGLIKHSIQEEDIYSRDVMHNAELKLLRSFFSNEFLYFKDK